MLQLIARRLLLLIPVLLGISVLTFVLSHVVPGDPARLIAGPHAGQAQVEATRRSFGLDRPLWVQYASYMAGLAHGDMGVALHTQRRVSDEMQFGTVRGLALPAELNPIRPHIDGQHEMAPEFLPDSEKCADHALL